MIYPVILTKNSAEIGDDCAYCKQPFTTSDAVVACPLDAVHHHSYCWEENGGSCAALACEGSGELGEPFVDFWEETPRPEPVAVVPQSVPEQARIRPNPTLRERPNSQPEIPQIQEVIAAPIAPSATPTQQPLTFTSRLAQNFLMFAVAIAILMIAFSCFGLWSIADYLMLEVLEFGYR